MNPETAKNSPRTRWQAWSGAGAFLAGLVAAIGLVRSLPPAPAFSPELGRATYLQSYETAYFASLRSYEEPIRALLAEGYVPIVIFGDSTIRGAGASASDLWSRLLEARLQQVNPRVRVLNYAQNAGDLLGPFLYHYLQHKFPDARYIVQWHFASEVGIRHQFHYWLTSEIALRDGQRNPAVARSFRIVPVTKADERSAFVMASLNIATGYLDAGNWLRFRWLGQPIFDWDRKVRIKPLSSAADPAVSQHKFEPVDQRQADMMRYYFGVHQESRAKYVKQDRAQHVGYFAEMFPQAHRPRLLLLTLDFNPYYAPVHDEAKMQTWRSMWHDLRREMAEIPDLAWLSMTGSAGDLEVDDFADLGHLSVPGQRKLAEAVAAKICGPGGWLDPGSPGAIPPPANLQGRWIETAAVAPFQLAPFQFMQPRPVRFFSRFGPGLDHTLYNAHPETRLRFQPAAGRRRLQTSLHFNPNAYQSLPSGETGTDGVQLQVALVRADGHREVLMDRLVNPTLEETDRAPLQVDLSFDLPVGVQVEIYLGPGPAGQLNRDWVSLDAVIFD